MNRSELVTALAEKTGYTKKVADDFLRSFVDIVSEELKKGEKDLISVKSFKKHNFCQ